MEETNKKEEYLKERYTLAMERIHGIVREETVPAPFCVYFKKTSEFLIQVEELWTKLRVGETKNYTLEQWQELNHKMYGDILPEHYDVSYGNPDYAVAELGEVHGKLLSFLYTELRALLVMC